METPPNAFYEGLTQAELMEQLSLVETEINGLHVRRAELNQEEDIAQEHRDAIVRSLGVYVLNDRRRDVAERG